MFIKNRNHLQPTLFSPENQMKEAMQAKLKGHWSGIFYEEIFKTIDESIFAPLYSEVHGRPNFPVNILAALEIIKELQSLTDEVLYENYLFNYTFHRAMGIENIENHIFELRTLYNFRSRLAEYESITGRSLFQQIFKNARDEIISELGIKTGLQRTDSVLISANIKRMSRLMLFHKVYSNLVRDITDLRIELSDKYMELVKEDEDSIAYRLKREDVPLKLSEIAERLHQLVVRFKDSQSITLLKSYKDAERLLKEQCRIERGNLEILDPVLIKSSSMQNPADTDATYRRKDDNEYIGYATHATETCDPENPFQIITHVKITRNNADDAAVLAGELPEIKE